MPPKSDDVIYEQPLNEVRFSEQNAKIQILQFGAPMSTINTQNASHNIYNLKHYTALEYIRSSSFKYKSKSSSQRLSQSPMIQEPGV